MTEPSAFCCLHLLLGQGSRWGCCGVTVSVYLEALHSLLIHATGEVRRLDVQGLLCMLVWFVSAKCLTLGSTEYQTRKKSKTRLLCAAESALGGNGANSSLPLLVSVGWRWSPQGLCFDLGALTPNSSSQAPFIWHNLCITPCKDYCALIRELRALPAEPGLVAATSSLALSPVIQKITS